jgi:hypothetical protein
MAGKNLILLGNYGHSTYQQLVGSAKTHKAGNQHGFAQVAVKLIFTGQT